MWIIFMLKKFFRVFRRNFACETSFRMFFKRWQTRMQPRNVKVSGVKPREKFWFDLIFWKLLTFRSKIIFHWFVESVEKLCPTFSLWVMTGTLFANNLQCDLFSSVEQEVKTLSCYPLSVGVGTFLTCLSFV